MPIERCPVFSICSLILLLLLGAKVRWLGVLKSSNNYRCGNKRIAYIFFQAMIREQADILD